MGSENKFDISLKHEMRLFCILFGAVLAQNCIRHHDPKGAQYMGTLSHTKNGRYGVRECVSWSDVTGKDGQPKFRPIDGALHSFCRNPDNDPRGPWCYVKRKPRQPNYGYCDVPKCPTPGSVRPETSTTTTTTSTTTTTKRTTAARTTSTTSTSTQSTTTSTRFRVTSTSKRMTRRLTMGDITAGRTQLNSNDDTCGVQTICVACMGKTGLQCEDKLPGDTNKLSRQRIPVSEIEMSPNGAKVIGKVTGKTYNAAKYGSCAYRNRRSAEKTAMGMFGFVGPDTTELPDYVEHHGDSSDSEWASSSSSEIDEGDELQVAAMNSLNSQANHSSGVQQTSTLADRIIGGFSVSPDGLPWQVCIRQKTTKLHFCGGTIISPKLVVTAAHCRTQSFASRYFVTTGHGSRDYFGARNEPGYQESKVVAFDNWPQYDKDHVYGDLAMIELETPFHFTEYVKPACMPQRNFKFAKGKQVNCVVSGWGDTSGFSEFAQSLGAAVLQFFPPRQCNEIHNGGVLLGDGYDLVRMDGSQVCFGFQEGNIDACQGDSGGPLVCMINKRWTLFGVVSFGRGCAEKNKPGVYTKVSFPKFYDFIMEKMNSS